MQISRNSFIYKTAYYFTDTEKRPVGNIDGCTLFWRFILLGIAVLLVTVTLLPIISAIAVGILAIRWIVGILAGYRLEHYRKSVHEDFWVESIFVYALPTDWRWVKIASWPTIFGWRILPLGIILTLAMVAVLSVFLFMNWTLGQMAYEGDHQALLVMLGEALIPIGVACVFLVLRLRQSSLWQLLSANVRSIKDRTCPVVEIV